MSFKFLSLNKENQIWTLTLQRPEALNALNQQVLSELSEALDQAAAAFPKDCRGLILTGAGEKSFVAGADIKEMSDLSVESAQAFASKGQSVFRKIESLPMPVLAAVNGFALGGGLELALSCDFIYVSDNARVGLPEVGLGLIPGFGGTVRLARVVGLSKARELVLSGEMLKAPEALAWGIANRMYPQAELLPAAMKTMQTIASRGPVAVKVAKRVILEAWDQDLGTAMQTESRAFGQLFATKDMLEGTKAFTEKRKPSFEGA